MLHQQTRDEKKNPRPSYSDRFNNLWSQSNPVSPKIHRPPPQYLLLCCCCCEYLLWSRASAFPYFSFIATKQRPGLSTRPKLSNTTQFGENTLLDRAFQFQRAGATGRPAPLLAKTHRGRRAAAPSRPQYSPIAMAQDVETSSARPLISNSCSRLRPNKCSHLSCAS